MGVRARRVEKYYRDLLASETDSGNHSDQQPDGNNKGSIADVVSVPEKWKGQIEKVIAPIVF